MEYEPCISTSTLYKLLIKLPRLSSLELSELSFIHSGPEDDVKSHLGSANRLSLECLYITCSNDPDDRFANFIVVINLFEEIGTLRVECPSSGWSEEFYGTSRPLTSVHRALHLLGEPLITTRVKSLVVENDENPCADVAILEVLRSGPSVKSLRLIDVETSQFDELLSLFQFLGSPVENLSDLTFDVAEQLAECA